LPFFLLSLALTLSLDWRKSDAFIMTAVMPSFFSPPEAAAPAVPAPLDAAVEEERRDETDLCLPSALPAVSASSAGYAPEDVAPSFLAPPAEPPASANASRYADSTGSNSSSAKSLSRT